MAEPAPAISFDAIFSPEQLADPYPIYRTLRETSPVFHVPDTTMWIVSRYADVTAVLRDKRLGHLSAATPNLTEEQRQEIMDNPALAGLSRTMLLQNPPDHTRLRSLVVKAFDARRIERMRERIRSIANELVDQLLASNSGDLVRGFNHPLPVIVICDLLGVPEADRAGFIEDTNVQGRLIDPTPMTQEELDLANVNMVESAQYFEALCEERRKHPQDDLLTALVESETEQGKLTKAELTSNISLLFAAGHETTVNLLGNALLALYRNRDQLDLLRATPELFASSADEFIRYDSSVQLTARGTFEPIELGGHEIPAGHEVLTLLGAANRDPDQFDNPEQLDVTRQNVKPASFGGGIHYCLGAQLARLETEEALRILLERLPELELDNIDTPEWKQTITLRGVKTLPAHW
jgi:cytochrome P450